MPTVSAHDIEWELMQRDPMRFRENLIVDVDQQRTARLGPRMDPFQREDFEAIDPALKWLAGRGDEPVKTRFWLQRPRGHSKTSDTATSITWLLWAGLYRKNGIGFAEDKKQAALLYEAMDKLRAHNPWLNERLRYYRSATQTQVVNVQTGSSIEIWSSDVASSWGIIPDFVIVDEITHWTNQELWTSVFSSWTKREGLLAVLCNAGWGRDWRWEIKLNAMKHRRWYHASREGAIATWISQEALAEQKACLPPAEYGRLWLNMWQETGGEFVTLEEAMACRDPALPLRDRTPADGWPFIASVDYAPKHDRTVGTVLHQEADRLIVDRMDVICPTATKQATRVEWVDQWCDNVRERFGGKHGQVYFVFDEYQLLGTIQRLEEVAFVHKFDFESGNGNWRMGMALRLFIIHQKIRWYGPDVTDSEDQRPTCGLILDQHGAPIKTPLERDDLEIELASLVVKPYANGKRWRFDHLQDGVHHDDRAYSLGAAVLFAVENSGGYEEWGFSESLWGGLDLKVFSGTGGKVMAA